MSEFFDPNFMHDLVKAIMPYGKYEGRKLYQIPVYYLEWMERQGWPKGRLGQQLATMYEIKTNGLDAILDPFIKGIV